jgi:hypothetical protein
MKLTVYLEDPERIYTIPLTKLLGILGVQTTEEDILKAIQKALVDK